MGKHLLSPPSRGEAPKSLSTSSSSHYFFTLTTKHYLNSSPWFSHIFQFPLLLVSSPCLHSPFHHSLAFLPGPGVSSRAMRQFWEAHCVRRCHGLSSPSWGSFDGAGDYSPRSLGCIPLSHCSGCRIYIHICSHRGAILKVIAQKKKLPLEKFHFVLWHGLMRYYKSSFTNITTMWPLFLMGKGISHDFTVNILQPQRWSAVMAKMASEKTSRFTPIFLLSVIFISQPRPSTPPGKMMWQNNNVFHQEGLFFISIFHITSHLHLLPQPGLVWNLCVTLNSTPNVTLKLRIVQRVCLSLIFHYSPY